MCVGVVESCEKSGNFREISVNKAMKTLSPGHPYMRCVLVTCGQTDWLGSLCLSKSQGSENVCGGGGVL